MTAIYTNNEYCDSNDVYDSVGYMEPNLKRGEASSCKNNTSFTVVVILVMIITGLLIVACVLYAMLATNITTSKFFSTEESESVPPSTVWKVIQRRVSSKVDFKRVWASYKEGFGDKSDSFWLGLDKMHKLTREPRKLRIQMRKWNDSTVYTGVWSHFQVGSEAELYRLSLTSFCANESNVEDSLSHLNGSKFNTRDRDNSLVGHKCQFYGAFWYTTCHGAGHGTNFNGEYFDYPTALKTPKLLFGIVYDDLTEYDYSLPFVEMAIEIPYNGTNDVLM